MLGALWKRWHWLDDGLMPLTATISYAAWAYPVFAVYMRDPSTGERTSGFSFWLCLGLLLGGTLAGRLAGRLRRGAALVVGGGFVAAAVCLLLIAPVRLLEIGAWATDASSIPMIVAGAVLALLLWWRGVRLSHADHHEETSRTFVVGALALACLLLASHMHDAARPAQALASTVWMLALVAMVALVLFLGMLSFLGLMDERVLASGGEVAVACAVSLLATTLPSLPPPEALSSSLLLFIVFGLLTRSFLGVSWVLNNQRGRGGVRLHVDRNWLVVMVGAVLGIVSLGLLVGEVLTPDAVRSAWAWVRPVLIFCIATIAFVLMTVAWAVVSFIRRVAPGFALRLPQLTLPSIEDVPELGERTRILSPAARQVGLTLIVLAVLALVAWILYRAARRLDLEAWAHADASEDRETFLSWQLLLRQLRGVLDGLRGRRATLFVELGLIGRARRTIRKAYQRVLARAVALNVPRDRRQTPRAYSGTLTDLCPEARSSLESLTSAYEVARYGALPPTQEQAEMAQKAFDEVDANLRAATVRRASQLGPPDVDT